MFLLFCTQMPAPLAKWAEQTLPLMITTKYGTLSMSTTEFGIPTAPQITSIGIGVVTVATLWISLLVMTLTSFSLLSMPTTMPTESMLQIPMTARLQHRHSLLSPSIPLLSLHALMISLQEVCIPSFFVFVVCSDLSSSFFSFHNHKHCNIQ